ncbi:MAG: hypothetical protein PHX83_09175 [Acidobacteriia bacterium]|nr:hypothetical protein [Terriglobia bacterium]
MRRLVVVFALVVAFAGFLGIGYVAFRFLLGSSSFSTSSAPPGWVEKKDPQGFIVQIPRGWSAVGDRTSGKVEIKGNSGESVTLWPVFVAARLNSSSATSIVRGLAKQLSPAAEWLGPEPMGPSAIRLRGRSGSDLLTAAMAWNTSNKGTAGLVYLISCPEARYQSSQDAFVHILESFRMFGPPASEEKGQELPRFVRWDDPREHAFSVDVPEGWMANGGMFRFASVDTRPVVDAASPDGTIHITGGDKDIPPFTMPNQMLAFAGFREGSWYSPGYGVQMMVRRYQTGAEFVRSYVESKIAPQCIGLVFDETRDRPDISRAINAIYAQFSNSGVRTQLSTGETAFHCQSRGQPMNGYYLAGTMSTLMTGNGLWNVQILYGFLAPSAQTRQAQAILEHMVQSFQYNPQWSAMQSGIAMQTSKIVTQTNNEITNMIDSSYWNRQKTLDEISRRRSNATLGVEDVIDPLTGDQMKVESGSNYYWIDQHGAIVGTNTDTRPNLDFRKMVQLP